MGHNDRERRRLSLQAAVLKPLTLRFLQRAGIGPGMRVLDLGCGVGEVSLIAASLVGPHGHVTGVDLDAPALAIARAKAAETGHANLDFVLSALSDYRPATPYDAVIGRHILIHTPDPVEVIRTAASMVRPQGIVAFHEYDLAHTLPSAPPVPLWDRVNRLFPEFFLRAVPFADIGLRLFSMMQEAGLPAPECMAEAPVDGGAASPIYEWIAETVRSLLPKLEACGIATAAEIDVDTLADRLRDEAVANRATLFGPLLVGAFTRTR
jgi:SAM-dependent methyltransferase